MIASFVDDSDERQQSKDTQEHTVLPVRLSPVWLWHCGVSPSGPRYFLFRFEFFGLVRLPVFFFLPSLLLLLFLSEIFRFFSVGLKGSLTFGFVVYERIESKNVASLMLTAGALAGYVRWNRWVGCHVLWSRPANGSSSCQESKPSTAVVVVAVCWLVKRRRQLPPRREP